MTEESVSTELPLFARVNEINSSYYNFIDIFGIDTSADVNDTIKKLMRLQFIYHPDKCSESNRYTTEQVNKCEVISRKITKIIEILKRDNNYDFLKQLSPPQTIISVKESLNDVTDTANLEQTRKFYMNLLNQPEILHLATRILLALKQKYSSVDETSFSHVLESVAKNITLSFFDDKYPIDSLKEQILAFIKKSELLPNRKYKLHDIIDLAGYDRKNLGHDYCVALNIFFNLMRKVFGFYSPEPEPTFGISSFYKHKDRCMDPSYSPEPTKGSDLSFKNTRVSELFKFKKLQNELNIDKIKESIHIPIFTHVAVDVDDATEAEGGSKSRRRHRRHRKPVRKTRRGRGRGRGRGRTRKSKSKRQIRARKYKKNTYKRCM
jgi:hypothetical protein